MFEQPQTNTVSYWLNWRFFLTASWVLASMVASIYIICKLEGPKRSKIKRSQDTVGTLYKDEFWRTSCKVVDPLWLLAYRIAAFGVLLGYVVHILRTYGKGIFYFYTQWTFGLVAVYFGLASLFSIYGCWNRHYNKGGGATDVIDLINIDMENENILEENANKISGSKGTSYNGEQQNYRETANILGYILQIVFQTSAGAAMLTDLVFWFILYPFLAHYDLTFFDVSMHTVNIVFLIGDLILNTLRFPFFRVAYMIWWTSIYVIYQWIVHVCADEWWPYSFLDLSFQYSPLWYMAVGILHIPCFGIFVLIMRYKHSCLSRSTTDTSWSFRYIGTFLSSHMTLWRSISRRDKQ